MWRVRLGGLIVLKKFIFKNRISTDPFFHRKKKSDSCRPKCLQIFLFEKNVFHILYDHYPGKMFCLEGNKS